MKLCKLPVILAMSVLAGSGQVDAGTVDVVEYSTGFFTPFQTDPYDYFKAPYFRWWNEDWEWQHAAVATTGLASATLSISAWDVDKLGGEVDIIQLWNLQSSSWVGIGSLVGSHSAWADTSFVLDASWYDEIADGLKVRIDIDSTHSDTMYAVTLSKSALSVTPVPLPPAAWLFGTGLLGLMTFLRWSKART